MPPIMSKPSLISSSSTTLVLVLLAKASAQCTTGVISQFTGTCDFTTFNANLNLPAGCTLAALFPPYVDSTGATVTRVPANEIAEICRYDAPVQFVEINGYYQLDRRYMDGGGPLIDSQEDFEVEAGRILRFNDNEASNAQIGWPEYAALLEYNAANSLGNHGYPPNFDLVNSCDLNTVMCCYIDDVNDAGFPAGTTTDVCRHDLQNSAKSNHIKDGWSVFPGAETPTHCVGFTWVDGAPSDIFKGNALFDVSLRTTATKGYYKSIPGAPLCACIEQMPIVEKASCRKATGGAIQYTFEFDAESGSVTASNEVAVTYSDCAGDLKAEVIATQPPAMAAKIENHLVGAGGCAASNAKYLNDVQFLVAGTHPTKYKAIPEDKWTFVVGEGIRFMPPDVDPAVADTKFRALVEKSAGCKDGTGNARYCIIRRFCDTCFDSHRDIYYVRKTAIPAPADLYFLDLFMNNWNNAPANVLGTDFDLYSSYADALAGQNAWTYCNYNDPGIGFPRDCAPSGGTWSQWNSYIRSGGYADHHGFYVEKP